MHFRSFQIFRDAFRIFRCWFEICLKYMRCSSGLTSLVCCFSMLFLSNYQRARTTTRIVGGSWEAEEGMKVWQRALNKICLDQNRSTASTQDRGSFCLNLQLPVAPATGITDTHPHRRPKIKFHCVGFVGFNTGLGHVLAFFVRIDVSTVIYLLTVLILFSHFP